MDIILKAAVAYVVLWIIIRLSGRRTVGQLTTFDLLLFLVIGGVSARAIMGQDYALTSAFLVVMTIVLIDVGLSLLERDSPSLSRILKGVPTLVVENGRVLEGRMRRCRLTEDDVMQSARRVRGIHRMEDIRFAVLEADGSISIIPREGI